MLKKEIKEKLIKSFAKSDKDVGSIEVQLGLISARIDQISKHLKSFPKDKHSRIGLLKLVGKKKKFEDYLQRTNKVDLEKVKQQLNA